MELNVTQFVTLDGVVQSPGAAREDPEGGFGRGGWVVPHFDEDAGAAIDAWFSSASAFLFGRKTYEVFAEHWPHVTDADDPVATRLNGLPKYVASTTLARVDWQHARLLDGDVSERVAELKRDGDGELQVHGSGALTHSLLAAGLVDEFRLIVFPVVVGGGGKRLFPDGGAPAALRLTDARTTSTGAAIHTYRVVGEPTYGDVGEPGA